MTKYSKLLQVADLESRHITSGSHACDRCNKKAASPQSSKKSPRRFYAINWRKVKRVAHVGKLEEAK